MEIKVFNGDFGSIRVLKDENNNAWFALVDVCNALDIKNPRDAKSRLKEDGVGNTDAIDSLGRKQNITIINEANLYRLIFQSRKKEAIRFQDWVTEEVLPAIRKYGAYLTPEKTEELINNPDLIIELATNLKKEREEKLKLQAELQKNQPYITFAKQAEVSNTSIKIGQWSKIISNKCKVQVGVKKLFKWLRDNKYLRKDNLPYQQYEEKGYFEVKSRIVLTAIGPKQTFTTYITSKGQVALTDKVISSFIQENQVKDTNEKIS